MDTDAPRILLVDDEEPILFALSEYLTAIGFSVDCARELEEAQALVMHVAYGCLIADLRLSGTHGAEGLELVSFVRRICAATRVILLTAYGSLDTERVARARGADGFLQKPIALAALADMVRAFVSVPC
jgi:DNA-binding response OmpR family regulator